MGFFLLTLFMLQAPGDGWTLVQAPPREVEMVYWSLFETTEVWMRLVPDSPIGEPPRVTFIFQAFFPGRQKRDPYSGDPVWPEVKPERLTFRVQALPLTVTREFSLGFVIDGESIDLTKPGSDLRYLGCPAPSNECAITGVEVGLEPSLLESLMMARSVLGEALGFAIELTEADQFALADFASRIGLSEDAATK